ncbi:MAG: F0F1 ATP synthase subunit B [Oculatellaceae cyanobacterium Prado106]|nr:F0F1 ATP synthase subunit B [Oculatellaceae cyanobacterium Prado106]
MFILLTAEAAEHGFGLNFNILETNLINLAVVISVVVYFGRKLLGAALGDRQTQIATAIREVEQKKQEAAAALADQQQKLAQAQTEAARIRAAAEESAKAAREAIMAQAAQDLERLRASAAQDLNTQQERIMTELRQQIAALAMQQVEAQLRSGVSDETQARLIDRSIAQIGV